MHNLGINSDVSCVDSVAGNPYQMSRRMNDFLRVSFDCKGVAGTHLSVNFSRGDRWLGRARFESRVLILGLVTQSIYETGVPGIWRYVIWFITHLAQELSCLKPDQDRLEPVGV